MPTRQSKDIKGLSTPGLEHLVNRLLGCVAASYPQANDACGPGIQSRRRCLLCGRRQYLRPCVIDRNVRRPPVVGTLWKCLIANAFEYLHGLFLGFGQNTEK